MKAKLPKVAVLCSQFAAYHVDRCVALADRLAGRAEVIAVEVASASSVYAWPPSGEVAGAEKRTLFPGRSHDEIGTFARLWHQWRALRGCRVAYIGVSYHYRDIIMLAWLLRLGGTRVILMSDSKFDDLPRRVWFELFKAFLLLGCSGVIVAGLRQIAYYRSLGFVRRPVLPGYDGVSVARIRAEVARNSPGPVPFDQRPFLFIGRFVPKKNLNEELIKAVRTVYSGEQYFSPSLGKPALRIRGRLGSLSDQPREVFHLFVRGRTPKQIADELYISVNTVYSHVTNIKSTLGHKHGWEHFANKLHIEEKAHKERNAHESSSVLDDLTERQRKVFDQYVGRWEDKRECHMGGITNPENIAEALGVSVGEVKDLIQEIHYKLSRHPDGWKGIAREEGII